jgi:hypothetical protein
MNGFSVGGQWWILSKQIINGVFEWMHRNMHKFLFVVDHINRWDLIWCNFGTSGDSRGRCKWPWVHALGTYGDAADTLQQWNPDLWKSHVMPFARKMNSDTSVSAKGPNHHGYVGIFESIEWPMGAEPSRSRNPSPANSTTHSHPDL